MTILIPKYPLYVLFILSICIFCGSQIYCSEHRELIREKVESILIIFAYIGGFVGIVLLTKWLIGMVMLLYKGTL